MSDASLFGTVLENEIIPEFYKRDEQGVPRSNGATGNIFSLLWRSFYGSISESLSELLGDKMQRHNVHVWLAILDGRADPLAQDSA